jgi:glycosyltransferase involved in cell wall biosynthesis
VRKPAIHILSELKSGPWGGGNQFLKALREYLRKRRAYAESIDAAQVVIVNGHQWGPHLITLFRLKRARPELVIMHRVDGPMEVVRGRADNRIVDEAIVCFSHNFSDGTVFQSHWSRDLCIARGMDGARPHAIVLNAPDPSIFYPPANALAMDGKIRIISTSWSSNWRKGFDVFQHLDQHLDFSRYEFTFVGNSPIIFKNIRHINPLASSMLAEELRRHHIFLQASHLEACSNSLIEAMNCGLVPVARNNSSHPEIVGKVGVLFEGIDDVVDAIRAAAQGRADYIANMSQEITIAKAGRAYLDFAVAMSRAPSIPPSLYEFFVTWASWKMASRPGLFLKLRNVVGMSLRR